VVVVRGALDFLDIMDLLGMFMVLLQAPVIHEQGVVEVGAVQVMVVPELLGVVEVEEVKLVVEAGQERLETLEIPVALAIPVPQLIPLQ